MKRYLVEYIDEDERIRTTIVEADILPKFDNDADGRKPFVAHLLRRPKYIRRVEPIGGAK